MPPSRPQAEKIERSRLRAVTIGLRREQLELHLHRRAAAVAPGAARIRHEAVAQDLTGTSASLISTGVFLRKAHVGAAAVGAVAIGPAAGAAADRVRSTP